MGIVNRTAYKLVWRQSEFAFFVRWLRLAHFFILGGFYEKEVVSLIACVIVPCVCSYYCRVWQGAHYYAAHRRR